MRTPRKTLVAIFVVAFCVRLVWLLAVQHPLHAVYSDMGGYVDRAEQLLWHLPNGYPRVLAIYPWGTHALFAAEFGLLGRHAEVPIAVAHALLGAIPVPCMVVLTARIVRSHRVAAAVGLLVAFWPPQVAFAGFFLSEPWYAAAIALQAVWTSSEGRGPVKLLGTSLISAIAFVVRPQFIVTWALDLVRCAWGFVRRAGLLRSTGRVVLLVLPMLLFIAGSAVRLHNLSGHWGLISENDEMTRIWADTEICQLKSSWDVPGGGRYSYWFNPPSKPATKPSDIEEFEGYIADPVLLRQIRLRRMAGVPLKHRLWRRLHNVALLFTGNLPWPESNFKDPHWRRVLQETAAAVTLYAVLPLAFIGSLLGRRNAALFIAALNSATCIVCAAFFFGEARYHVPYDPFFLVLAATGCWEVGRRVGPRVARWFRSLRARRVGAPALS